MAHKVFQKFTMLRRMKYLLDFDGRMTLYKSKVKPVMECTPFIWMSSDRCHLTLEDNVQRRAERLIGATHSQPSYQGQRQHRNQDEDDVRTEQTTPLDSLEHCRRVAALTVLYKVQMVQVPYLIDLRAN